MTRLVLLSVLCLLTWYYFPESRAILKEAADPLMAPLESLTARDEMERLGRNVVEHERLTGDVPEGGAWLSWLEERYATEEVGRDRWGSTYQLVVWPDSVGIVSYGPDRLLGTDDDLQVVTPRG